MSGADYQNCISSEPIIVPIVVNQDSSQRQHANSLQRIIWTIDKRIMPFLFVLEFSSYINRISMGLAKLNGLNDDLKLSSDEDNWSISLFFIGHLLFEIPFVLLVRIIGPPCFISLGMIAWGAITVGTAFVKNARELLITRFLLGVAEAGFFPSNIIYISMWYRKQEQTVRFAIFYGAAILSGAFGGILAYGISKMDGIGNLDGWRWIFLLEGLPIIPLGFVTFFLLERIPDTVQCLNNSDKDILTNMLCDDAGVANSASESSARLSWCQVRHAFVDRHVYFYAAIAVGNTVANKCFTVYLPSLVKGMDYSNVDAQLISAPPYVIAFICALLGAFSSTKKNEHGYHLSFFISVCALGFLLLAIFTDKSKVGIYLGVCLVCSGAFAAFPILLSWLTHNIGGHTKRAVAVGFVIGTGPISGVVAPQIYRNEDAPGFRRGHIICGSVAVVTLFIILILRYILKQENKRRENLTPTQRDRETQTKEPCDWHPDVRYVL